MYYRNITDIISDQNIEIEAGSLWVYTWSIEESDRKMILEDDDQHITVEYVAEAFQYVAKEYGMKLYSSIDFQKLKMTFGNDLGRWILTGSNQQDYMQLGFKTLITIDEVKEKLKASGVSSETLEEY